MNVSEFIFSILSILFSSFSISILFIFSICKLLFLFLFILFLFFSEFILEMLSHLFFIFWIYVISWHFNMSFIHASLSLFRIMNLFESNKSLFNIPFLFSDIKTLNLSGSSFISFFLLILLILSSGNSKWNKQLLLYIIPVFLISFLKSNLNSSLLILFLEWSLSQLLWAINAL